MNIFSPLCIPNDRLRQYGANFYQHPDYGLITNNGSEVGKDGEMDRSDMHDWIWFGNLALLGDGFVILRRVAVD